MTVTLSLAAHPLTRGLALAATLGAALVLAPAAQAFNDPSPLTPKERANPASAPRVPGHHTHARHHRRSHRPRAVLSRTTTVTRIEDSPAGAPR